MKHINLSGKRGAGKYITVDDADFDVLIKHKWYLCANGYVATNIYIKWGISEYVMVHRFIMNPKDGEEIDHKDLDKLNNQRSNLRNCTRSQNMMNTNKRINNKTGYKGVLHYKSGWRVQLQRNHVGVYKTKAEAANAYNNAAIKKYGEFARLNDIPK